MEVRRSFSDQLLVVARALEELGNLHKAEIIAATEKQLSDCAEKRISSTSTDDAEDDDDDVSIICEEPEATHKAAPKRRESRSLSASVADVASRDDSSNGGGPKSNSSRNSSRSKSMPAEQYADHQGRFKAILPGTPSLVDLAPLCERFNGSVPEVNRRIGPESGRSSGRAPEVNRRSSTASLALPAGARGSVGLSPEPPSPHASDLDIEEEPSSPGPPTPSRSLKSHSITSVSVPSGIKNQFVKSFAELSLRKEWKDVDPELMETTEARFQVTVNLEKANKCKQRPSQSGRQSLSPTLAFVPISANDKSYLKRCGTVMSPIGYPRLCWNGLSLVIICYDLFMIPMQAFGVGDEAGFVAVEWMATFFWLIDLFLCFRTGYFVGSNIEMRPRLIAIRYVKTWLLVDLVIVTLELVSRIGSIIGSASFLRTSRIFRTVRFVKLVRLAKMRELLMHFADQINSNFARLVGTMAVLGVVSIIIIHIVACIWFALGEANNDGWQSTDQYTGNKNTLFWYVASARWVISQANGRTDIKEDRNMLERMFTCLVGITLGSFAHAIFISIITKSLLDLSELVSEKTHRHRLVNDYLEKFPVPPGLNSSVKRYLSDYQDADKDQENEKMILSILPKNVQTQLLFEVRSPVIIAHPLFSNMNDEFQWFMRHLCRKVVKLAAAVKHEVVFDKGDACCRMLFMDKCSGRYVLQTEKRSSVRELNGKINEIEVNEQEIVLRDNLGVKVPPRSWISEPALWVEWLNRGRLVSASHGHMFAIESMLLAEGLQSHPDTLALTVLYARSLVQEMNDEPGADDLADFSVEFAEVCNIHLRIKIESAKGLTNMDTFFAGKSDPYCVCKAQDFNKSRSRLAFLTQTVSNDLNPVWNHTAFVSLSSGQCLVFEVWDSDAMKTDELLGEVCVESSSFLPDGFEGELELGGGSRKGPKGSISVKICVEEMEARQSSKSSSLPGSLSEEAKEEALY